MTSISTTVAPAIQPAPKFIPQSFGGTTSSPLGADQKAAALAHTAATKAVSQLAADTKAQAGSNTLKIDQQSVTAKQAAAAKADAKVKQDTSTSTGVNVTA